ncbi:hypothetical protein K474DRAFT_1696036 [Panus rudis PR-1116 ss-1]|nr:hypothetical protein K474DRAFT_1696036 [Panus rudis PR-1116 ss-1]
MDVDEDDEVYGGLNYETLFAKSEEMQVSFYAHLPVEVKQILRSANFYRDAYTGDVDTVTKFALVASSETCFVWNYTQALTGTPTCYIFACPPEAVPMPMSTPFHALVPYNNQREPGQIRFWESLASGLAGGEHWSPTTLDLLDEERVTTLTRAEAHMYIASTSIGRLFRLSLTSSGGRYHISPRAFSRPQSSLSLSRLLPSFWSGGSSVPLPTEFGNISSVALREYEQGGRDVWALIDFRIQRWTMSADGWEELELDEDIAELVRPAIKEKFESAPKDDSELDLELLDLKLVSTSELLLLVSYAGQEDSSLSTVNYSSHPRRIYALITLAYDSEVFSVANIRTVPYQSTSSSGAPMHPRMKLIRPGKLVIIQFGDTVTVCAVENEFMDRLELKSASDRTLGIGIVEKESEFLVLTAATLMKTYVDIDAVKKFDPEHGRANLIKSTMTQAILYGSHPENPLYFSFPPEIDEEALMIGAEQLSRAILESDTKVVRPNPDLQAQIIHRRERLSFLIKFINDNAVLTKMTQRSRQHLEADAEKLFAAQQLWLKFNESLLAGNDRSVLSEAVYRYMLDVGEGHHEDFMRAFFRLEVARIADIFPKVLAIVRDSARDLTKSQVDTVPQANHIVLTVLESAYSCREENLGLYGIEPPLIDPWTSQPALLDIVSELFAITTTIIQQSSSEPESSSGSRTQARKQLPSLAAALLSCYYERLQWLGSRMAASENGNALREKSSLEDRFKQTRPEVLETLRRNGFAQEAFTLAEQYRDFRSLASLCNKETIYPPHENPHASRIQLYINKFKEAFTTELFQWYIEHGELRTMFALQLDQDEYLDKFFAEHPYPNISWVHDLGKERYGKAAEALLEQSEHAAELSTKHLMLSIGKLSYLAQVHEPEQPVLDEAVIDAFHDGLDFVSVHETLIDGLRASLAGVRTKQSLEQQIETIAKDQATSLTGRRALLSVFKQLVRRLLQGKALSVEDIADVLSLKDNRDSVDDYVTALHLLLTAKTIPAARKLSAFQSVWRRIYLHDDVFPLTKHPLFFSWDKIRQTANVTDAELNDRFRNTALFTAVQATIHTHQRIPGYLLEPKGALHIPQFEELAARWPGTPAEDIHDILEDMDADCQELERLGLEDVFEKVKELAEED